MSNLSDRIGKKGKNVKTLTPSQVLFGGAANEEEKQNDEEEKAVEDNTVKDKKDINKKNETKLERTAEASEESVEPEKNSVNSRLSNLVSSKEEKVEDTHKRSTFLVRKDLLRRLNKIAKSQKHGFKTEFINTAIEIALDELERLQKNK